MIILDSSHLLFIEPPRQGKVETIIDTLTCKVTEAWRRRLTDPRSATRGAHECTGHDGASSDNRSHLLGGLEGNSLAIHYVAQHRNDIPQSEIAKIERLPFEGVWPEDHEINGRCSRDDRGDQEAEKRWEAAHSLVRIESCLVHGEQRWRGTIDSLGWDTGPSSGHEETRKRAIAYMLGAAVSEAPPGLASEAELLVAIAWAKAHDEALGLQQCQKALDTIAGLPVGERDFSTKEMLDASAFVSQVYYLIGEPLEEAGAKSAVVYNRTPVVL